MGDVKRRRVAPEVLTPLTAVTPLDGRYARSTAPLRAYMSEFALIRARVKVEIEYFIALITLIPQGEAFPKQSVFPKLRAIAADFSEEDAQKVKATEKVTNHDVKAVEYFIKGKFEELGIAKYQEWVHFALTSQDINNTATPLLLLETIRDWYVPELRSIIALIRAALPEWNVSMLARTHGQPASPTNLAKEFRVFVERLENQLDLLEKLPHRCKFGGATGNFNAHFAAFPKVEWVSFATTLCRDLGLERQQYTTQIEHYDGMGAIFDTMKRINTILLDLCRDVWSYVSLEYFKQKVVAGEIGSSAMPHKVNPIDFENAEGNIGIANAVFEHLSSKLPVSRLQRDLTDSTVCRAIGTPLGHTAVAFSAIKRGLGKLLINKAAIERDLASNWAVVAEAIQNVLRREGFPKPYEALKELTRGETVTEATIRGFIDKLAVSDAVKEELRAFTPFNYTGDVH
eukprot:TRINITY_DN8622_c0_g1_i1.p1 TRINITY_DN8622_c0_g1~~TRINITY_DN8622_c0_g1_i1.p1  ORF type:complete len:476 (+),score=226.27 TRINITY_DN8622_c0_g1_i1:57-1430(+)